MSPWKRLTTGGALLFALAGGAVAESLYVNGQAAMTKPTGGTLGYAAIMTVGVPIPERKQIFFEGELASTLIKPKRHGKTLSYIQIGGYAVYQQLINVHLAMHAKTGLVYQYSEHEADGSENGAAIAVTIGGTMHRSRTLSYLLELSSTRGTLDLTTLSFGIRYRFR